MPYFHAIDVDGQRFSRVATRAYSHIILAKMGGDWGEVGYAGRADLAAKTVSQSAHLGDEVKAFEVVGIEMKQSEANAKRKAWLSGSPAPESQPKAAQDPVQKAPAPKALAAKFTTREQWLQAFTDAARQVFLERTANELPTNVRCSVGFPSKGARSNTIGECWTTSVSEDQVFEIFIRPSLQSDASRIADVLTHELVHAACGIEEGHGKVFGRAARALGLEGKLTATVAGERWHEWADPILEELGDFPGAALSSEGLSSTKKKQTTRMLKAECPDCGFSFRTSAKHLDAHDELSCPTGCGGIMEKPE